MHILPSKQVECHVALESSNKASRPSGFAKKRRWLPAIQLPLYPEHRREKKSCENVRKCDKSDCAGASRNVCTWYVVLDNGVCGRLASLTLALY